MDAHTRATRSRSTLLSLWLAAASASLMLIGCTGADQVSAARFCEEIAAATGPEGAEQVLAARDPERLASTIDELKSLAETAPSEIDATTERMVEIFELIQRTPRSDVTEVLAEHQTEMQGLSQDFSEYAARMCQVDLTRTG